MEFTTANLFLLNKMKSKLLTKNPDFKAIRTSIKKKASIGANATILCGITIGENAMIGAGSVVTRDVPAGELWFGNPAEFHGKSPHAAELSSKE